MTKSLESFWYGFDSFHRDISLSDEVVCWDEDVVLMAVLEKLFQSVAEFLWVSHEILRVKGSEREEILGLGEGKKRKGDKGVGEWLWKK